MGEWCKVDGDLVIHLASENPMLQGGIVSPRSPSAFEPAHITHQCQSHNFLRSFISVTHLNITQVFQFVWTFRNEQPYSKQ